jgi:hypothetical protein
VFKDISLNEAVSQPPKSHFLGLKSASNIFNQKLPNGEDFHSPEVSNNGEHP